MQPSSSLIVRAASMTRCEIFCAASVLSFTKRTWLTIAPSTLPSGTRAMSRGGGANLNSFPSPSVTVLAISPQTPSVSSKGFGKRSRASFEAATSPAFPESEATWLWKLSWRFCRSSIRSNAEPAKRSSLEQLSKR